MSLADVPRSFVCVDCMGVCHLMTHLDPDDPPKPGDVLVYRCNDCYEPFYIVHEVDDTDAAQ